MGQKEVVRKMTTDQGFIPMAPMRRGTGGVGLGVRSDRERGGDIGRAGPPPPQPRRGGGGGGGGGNNNLASPRNGTSSRMGGDGEVEKKPGLPPRPTAPRDLMDDDDGELGGSGWEALRPS